MSEVSTHGLWASFFLHWKRTIHQEVCTKFRMLIPARKQRDMTWPGARNILFTGLQLIVLWYKFLDVFTHYLNQGHHDPSPPNSATQWRLILTHKRLRRHFIPKQEALFGKCLRNDFAHFKFFLYCLCIKPLAFHWMSVKIRVQFSGVLPSHFHLSEERSLLFLQHCSLF